MLGGQAPLDGGSRRSNISLGQTKKSQAGIRFPPELVRLPKGISRFDQVAQTEPRFADDIERLRGVGDHEVAKLLVGAACLRLRLLPVAPEPCYLRPVHAAQTREGADRLAVTPSPGGIGPFAGPLVIGHSLAGPDQVV